MLGPSQSGACGHQPRRGVNADAGHDRGFDAAVGRSGLLRLMARDRSWALLVLIHDVRHPGRVRHARRKEPGTAVFLAQFGRPRGLT
jgi:hypothetical protein